MLLVGRHSDGGDKVDDTGLLQETGNNDAHLICFLIAASMAITPSTEILLLTMSLDKNTDANLLLSCGTENHIQAAHEYTK